MNLRLLQSNLASVLITASFALLSLHAKADDKNLVSALIESHAQTIFQDTGATGMSMIVISHNQAFNHNFGETQQGNGIRPRKDSLIRIASITKLMTSEVMVKMAAEGKLKVTDPLSKYAPKGAVIPSKGSPIQLFHLASHTSGLPREQPGKPAKMTVFTWPTETARWNWLRKAKLAYAPGHSASYSNLAYDLLADALAVAGKKPYPALFREKITQPLGMRDTTFTPTAEQCARLMIGNGAGPCKSATAAIGSGGVYSTPQDMQIWMQQFLANSGGNKSSTLAQEHKIYFTRSQLASIQGMDVAGEASGLGLGWVYMQPHDGLTGILQKTGGGGGFMTYMALIPEKNIGIFVVITRGNNTKFRAMSSGVNKLATLLSTL